MNKMEITIWCVCHADISSRYTFK